MFHPLPDHARRLLSALRAFDWNEISERLRTPDNWPDGFESDLITMLEIANQDGVPIAWVPRPEVLQMLIESQSYARRSTILVERRLEVLDDCDEVLADLHDGNRPELLSIARRTTAACRDGHWEVGAIGAVAVVHSLVETLGWPKASPSAKKQYRLTLEHPYSELLDQSTRAPLASFYEIWNLKSHLPAPTQLSRHVVSHSLTIEHLSERNCIVAVMLMTSLLKTTAHRMLHPSF